jgi:hypothetical protein
VVHALALELGMTVARLSAEMGNREFQDWLSFYAQREEESKKPQARDLSTMRPEEIAAMIGQAR